MMYRHLLTATVLMLAATGIARAGPNNSYDIESPKGKKGAGDITHVDTSFDADTQTFTWEHSIKGEARSSGADKSDGFWLVVSGGPNPKGHRGEFAILFGDLDANRLWAYEYSGRNDGESWNAPGNLLAVWQQGSPVVAGNDPTDPQYNFGAGPFERTQVGDIQTVKFSIDVGHINARTDLSRPPSTDWQGVGFGSKVGIWFHAVKGASFTQGADFGLSGFAFDQAQSYYDVGGKDTTPVPEPTTLSMLGLGALLFARSRRRSARPVATV